jgi:hypothetical protein
MFLAKNWKHSAARNEEGAGLDSSGDFEFAPSSQPSISMLRCFITDKRPVLVGSISGAFVVLKGAVRWL